MFLKEISVFGESFLVSGIYEVGGGGMWLRRFMVSGSIIN
jgi:hypothetical protein